MLWGNAPKSQDGYTDTGCKEVDCSESDYVEASGCSVRASFGCGSEDEETLGGCSICRLRLRGNIGGGVSDGRRDGT